MSSPESRSRANPSTSSGVYVDPPPITAIFTFGYPVDRPGAYPRRTRRTDPHFAARAFDRGHGWGRTDDEDDEEPEGIGVVAVLTTPADDRAAWLSAGQALQRVLLHATGHGVSSAFHTQALEVPELRSFVRVRLCAGAYPQMIMRLGFADGEGTGARRPAADVTRPEP